MAVKKVKEIVAEEVLAGQDEVELLITPDNGSLSPREVIFQIADDVSAEKGSSVTLQELVKACDIKVHPVHVIIAEYGNWRKARGVVGRAAVKEKVEKVKVEKVAIERVVQNGVTKPLPSTKAGLIWKLADDLSEAKGAPVDSGAFLTACAENEYNIGHSSQLFPLWKKFYGIQTVRVKVEHFTVDELKEKIKFHEERSAKSLTMAAKCNDALLALLSSATEE